MTPIPSGRRPLAGILLAFLLASLAPGPADAQTPPPAPRPQPTAEPSTDPPSDPTGQPSAEPAASGPCRPVMDGVAPGDALMIERTDGTTMSAQFSRLDPEQLVVLMRGKPSAIPDVAKLPLNDIRRVQVDQRGIRGRHVMLGVAAGAAVGLLVGAIQDGDDRIDEGLLYGVPIGFVIGAAGSYLFSPGMRSLPCR